MFEGERKEAQAITHVVPYSATLIDAQVHSSKLVRSPRQSAEPSETHTSVHT